MISTAKSILKYKRAKESEKNYYRLKKFLNLIPGLNNYKAPPLLEILLHLSSKYLLYILGSSPSA